MNIPAFALRNLQRNWHRTLVTTSAMAFAGMIMILYAALMEGMFQTSERNAVAMDLGDIQIHAEGYRDDPDLYTRMDDADHIVSRLQKNGLYATQRLYGFGLAAAGSSSAGIQLRGIHLNNERSVTQIHLHIMQGHWLDASDPHGIVIGRKLARTLGVNLDDEIIVVSQATDGSMANDLYQVRGILKAVGEEIDRGGFYMLDSAFRELMVLPKGAHEIAVMRPDRSTDLEQTTRLVERLAPTEEVMHWRELRPLIAAILGLADTHIIIALLITYVAVAMVVLNAMLMSVFERIREFGVMKAVGFGPGQLTLLVYTEALIQVVVAAAVALLFGIPLAYYFQIYGIDLSAFVEGVAFAGIALDPVWKAYISERAVVLPVVALFIISALAVLYPALKAALIRPVQAIHYR